MSGQTALDNVKLHYVETSEEAARFIEWCKRPRYTMALDTETTGLERDARIRLIQFGDADEAWTLRWDRWKGTALEALDLLQRARQAVTWHNAPYDVPKLERQSAHDGDGFRTDWSLVDDTMIMSRLAEPTGSHALKSLATKLVDPRARYMQNVLSDAMAKNGWTWATVPYSYVGYNLYAGVDCVLAARVLPEIEKIPFSRELYATEMTCVEACIAMAEAGMAVDEAYCEEQAHQLGAEIEDVVAQARAQFGITALGSNQICIDRLHDLGFTWEERTDKGRVKLDADVLGRLEVEAPDPGRARLPRLILDYRQKTKLMNTYFANFISGAHEDGAVHPDINTLEAVTGRMSISQPAMQQLPRGPRVRRAIVARPGHYLVLADYSQIEIRVLAHYCQDPVLTEAIATGDVHTTTARLIYGRDDVTPQERQLAKSSALAIIYGAGDAKFSHTAGVTMEVGSAFLQGYHDRYRRVRPFMDEVQAVGKARRRGEGVAYVTTRDRRRLSMRKTDAFYTLVNYLCQGTAADIFKSALQRLHNAGMTRYMRLPVHDEVIFEVPDDVDPEEFKREAVSLMEDGSYRVPMTVEASGPFHSWADRYN